MVSVKKKKLLLRSIKNSIQSLLLILLMGILLAAIGYLIAGIEGLIISLLFGAITIAVTPRISPSLSLRMYKARKILPKEAPELYKLLYHLSQKAGTKSPEIYYIPSKIMNAFSVGNKNNSVIALTDGVLRSLNWKELSGVLAHEMSHIQNNDLWIMNLADNIMRFTSTLANFGVIMLIIYLPIYFISGSLVPFTIILLLIIAPRISLFLQMSLSRTREFEADLNAVKLIGDPIGLASALKKIDTHSMTIWDALLLPGKRIPAPSILRSHPVTEKRIEKLMEMKNDEDYLVYPHHLKLLTSDILQEVNERPKTRFFGLWH